MSGPNRFLSQASKATITFESRGAAGSIYASDTAKHTGPFTNIHALSDTVIASINGNMNTDATPPSMPTAIPLKAGDTLWGTFVDFTLTSGAVQAFKTV